MKGILGDAKGIILLDYFVKILLVLRTFTVAFERRGKDTTTSFVEKKISFLHKNHDINQSSQWEKSMNYDSNILNFYLIFEI